MNDFNAVEAKNACVEWIRQWFENNGNGCNAVIGISGGKDSTVVAALCVEALGKDKVIGVLMPNGYQDDIDDSYDVVGYLDIRFAEININKPIVNMYNAIHINNTNWAHGDDNMYISVSEQARINLPPRIRMATLYAVSQSVNGRVANTCNLSEDYIGYSTRWGDSVGDFAPLAHFTSEEVVAIGDACGLPYELTHKTPSDGLCGKTDEDNFGFTYKVLNKYIRTGECEDEEIKAKIDAMHKKNLFKLMPMPAFNYWEQMLWK